MQSACIMLTGSFHWQEKSKERTTRNIKKGLKIRRQKKVKLTLLEALTKCGNIINCFSSVSWNVYFVTLWSMYCEQSTPILKSLRYAVLSTYSRYQTIQKLHLGAIITSIPTYKRQGLVSVLNITVKIGIFSYNCHAVIGMCYLNIPNITWCYCSVVISQLQ